MVKTTKTRIVRIGNSRGIRVPKILLDQAQLPDEVELHAEPGRLVVQTTRRPRTGWAEAARAMAEQDQRTAPADRLRQPLGATVGRPMSKPQQTAAFVKDPARTRLTADR